MAETMEALKLIPAWFWWVAFAVLAFLYSPVVAFVTWVLKEFKEIREKHVTKTDFNEFKKENRAVQKSLYDSQRADMGEIRSALSDEARHIHSRIDGKQDK